MKLAEHPRPWTVKQMRGQFKIVDAIGKTVIGVNQCLSEKCADHIVHCVNSQAVRDR